MKNTLNIPEYQFRAIEALAAFALAEVRANLQQPTLTDAETREALMEYCADGGSVDDFFAVPFEPEDAPFAYDLSDSDRGLPPMGY